jgi:protein TonB
MKLTAFQVSLFLSLLVHGAIVGMVYAVEEPGAANESGTDSDAAGIIEIIVIPEESPALETQPVVAKACEPVAPKAMAAAPIGTPPVEARSDFPADWLVDFAQSDEAQIVPVPGPQAALTAPDPAPAATSTGPAPTVIGAGYLSRTKPVYPLEARRLRQEGLVILSLTVMVDGSGAEIRLKQSSGHHLLDEAALEAVKHWRFAPARVGSTAVSARVEVPIRFKLSN